MVSRGTRHPIPLIPLHRDKPDQRMFIPGDHDLFSSYGPSDSLRKMGLGRNQAIRESGLDGSADLQGLFHGTGRFGGEGPTDRKGGNGGIDFGTGMSVAAFQGPAQLGKDDVGDEENPVFPPPGNRKGP